MDDDDCSVIGKSVSEENTLPEPPKDSISLPPFEQGSRLSRKWTSGAGPRIGLVRDYPVDLQIKALEQVNLSPRVDPSPGRSKGPVPSPRPSPRVRLSPRLTYMGIPSPRVSLQLPTLKNVDLSAERA